MYSPISRGYQPHYVWPASDRSAMTFSVYLVIIFGWTVAVASRTVFAFISAGLWFFIRVDVPVPGRTGLKAERFKLQ